MKPLVFASYAQFGVDAEDENHGKFIMAYEIIPLFVETNYCGNSIRTTSDDITTKLDINLYCGESYVQCSLS